MKRAGNSPTTWRPSCGRPPPRPRRSSRLPPAAPPRQATAADPLRRPQRRRGRGRLSMQVRRWEGCRADDGGWAYCCRSFIKIQSLERRSRAPPPFPCAEFPPPDRGDLDLVVQSIGGLLGDFSRGNNLLGAFNSSRSPGTRSRGSTKSPSTTTTSFAVRGACAMAIACRSRFPFAMDQQQLPVCVRRACTRRS